MAKGIVEAVVKFDRFDRKRAELDALSNPLRSVLRTKSEFMVFANTVLLLPSYLLNAYLIWISNLLFTARRLFNRFMKIKHFYWIFLSSFFPFLFSLTKSFSAKRIDRFTMIRRIMIYMNGITVVIIELFICEKSNFRYLWCCILYHETIMRFLKRFIQNIKLT